MKECTVENCSEPIKFKGLCAYHYYRNRTNGDAPLHPSKRHNALQVCEVLDCNNSVFATHLCGKHNRTFYRWKKNGEIFTVGEFVAKWANRRIKL
ncbi:hypothetical protein AJGP001_10695 [Planococcus faecalis]|uniref:HNH endonuclease n=1 Tax=Planococcus faecalis TaxID=1598147 RepID=A0ABM6IT74_9BACL|nr:hypothetical protein AJGP001_10695 [Planococcus faecalis]OHX55278.1 hypothetical protein BB777_04360 [Planococcus faecalis]